MKTWKLSLVAIGVAAIAVTVWWQSWTNAALRREAERLRGQTAGIENLRADRERLAARQLAPQELAALKEDAAEAARLRAERDALRTQAIQPPERIAPVPAAPPPAENWRDSGRATPLATFHTAVWAVVQGDTNALAGLITFEPAGRAIVDALFARLPEDARASNGSAEKVFATLLATRLPQDLRSANVLTTSDSGGGEIILGIHLQRADGSAKDSKFLFRRDAKGWRVVVPTSVVENYTAMLKSRLPSRPDGTSVLTTPFKVD